MSKLAINRDTRLCMSLSARPGNFGTRFQNHLYEALGLDFVYKAFTTTDLPAAIAGIRALGIRGCAISMPFKEAVIAHLDALDNSAEAIGSVNTIVNDDGWLTGYNTDYIAAAALVERHAVSCDIRFALKGSGGMGKAVAAALADKGFANGVIVARNEAAGTALAQRCGWEWSTEVPADAQMLVNVTPLGMAGGAEAETLAFDEAAIARARLVFDCVAIPVETPLIRRARALGKPVITGGEVLVLQGVEQFTLYTGIVPTDAQLSAAATFALS